MRVARVHNYRNDKFANKSSKEITVDIKPIMYLEDLGVFDDPKEFYRFIVRTKYYIRKSYEYKELMKFMKKFHGMDHCGVHPNIAMDEGFSINIHHTPLVLEDIVHIVIAKRQKRNEALTQAAIAREVMELHYLGLFGLYPLCETCHEYAHGETNDLFIPLDAIYGDTDTFFDLYREFISEAIQHKYENLKVLTEGYTMVKNEIPEALTRKYIYVITEGESQLPSTRALTQFISDIVSN